MKNEQDYLQDLAEIRSMMERSSKFMSLSGLAGVMAGIYALTGVWIAWQYFGFNPGQITYSSLPAGDPPFEITKIILIGTLILILAVGTAILLSTRKANKRGEKAWNATSRRLIANMAVPLVSGGILLLVLISKGLIGWIAPLTLIFYGLALYNASKFTYNEVRFLGLIQIALGLIGAWFIEYSIHLWAFGFGVVHIIYGIYMHLRYER